MFIESFLLHFNILLTNVTGTYIKELKHVQIAFKNT